MANSNTWFGKDFKLSDIRTSVTYSLPCPESMFKESPWQLDNLQIMKYNLNEVKSCLNNYNLQEWHLHTSQMNEASDIVNRVRNHTRAELVTQAWCKFYEIASKNDILEGLIIRDVAPSYSLQTYRALLPLLNQVQRVTFPESGPMLNTNFISVHLCEAPGAFVAALNHWLKLNHPDVTWDWLATTLNPYWEGNSYDTMIADDRFIKHTLKKWCFGADNTGDIMDLKNLDALMEKSKSFENSIKLVTADGSIDCTNVPAEQESTVAQLHFCETVACLHLLNKGGVFVLKVFTLFEHQSVCLMYLLSCVFHQVIVTKPTCSKGGNSERYVVCKNFRGKSFVAPYLNVLRQHYGKVSPAKAMFNLRDIPHSFIQQIESCNKFFNHHQCQVINYNIRTYENQQSFFDYTRHRDKCRKLAVKYFNHFGLQEIKLTDQIVGWEIMEKSNNCFLNKLHSIHLKKVDSYNERLTCDVKPQTLLYRYFAEAKQITLPVEETYNWNLRILPESLEIQIGKPLNKVCSSYFCNARILQMLNGIDDIIQHTHLDACFSPAEITTEVARQMNLRHKILNLEFSCDSHQMIVKICDRLEKFEIGHTLILIGYSLLTQFNIALLCLLENTFDVTTIEIQNYRGYYIELKAYQHNEKVLNHLREILNASHEAREKNMAIWSIMPITNLYECDQVPMILQLNHLMIKLYIGHVFYKFLTQNKDDGDEHKSIANEDIVYKHDLGQSINK